MPFVSYFGKFLRQDISKVKTLLLGGHYSYISASFKGGSNSLKDPRFALQYDKVTVHA
jgi:hypothetical protein